MSTLPFLLSVADELDNINSQSYMDDFGLGFHPHRQYYRTPTIQLSLPASTEWMQQERQQRYRSHKFYSETQNNIEEDNDESQGDGQGEDGGDNNDYDGVNKYGSTEDYRDEAASGSSHHQYTKALNSNANDRRSTTTTTGCGALTKTATSTTTIASSSSASNKMGAAKSHGIRRVDKDDDDDENIDNSVRMYNLSKKCCKNYHRHAAVANAKDATNVNASGYKLHSKCMEANNSSSSDESLQKVSSSIEFLTCFLLKRSRAPAASTSAASISAAASTTASSSASSSKHATGAGKKS